MSVKNIQMQCVGDTLRNVLQPMERDVHVVYLDGKKFVPEETCEMRYDTVHHDYVCSGCGTSFYDRGIFVVDGMDNIHLRDYKCCPMCGRPIVEAGIEV